MKRKVVYAVLSLLCSLGLWMYVVTVENPAFEGTFYNIPVVFENEEILVERGLMITSDKIPTVTLKLSGNRTDVNKLDESNITILADLSKIYSSGEQKVSYTIMYPGDVPANSIEIINQTPQQIQLTFAEWKYKEVDVEVAYSGSVPEQFIAFKENATLDFPKIAVTGPATIIDRIDKARIQVNLDDRTETISEAFAYTFCDKDGNPVESNQIKANTDEIRYTLKIQRWKDIPVKVNIVDGGGIQGEDCQIVIDTSTIRVSGSEQVLEKLDELVIGEIRLGELTSDFQEIYNIEVPEGVTNLSEKHKVTVTIKLPNLELREFTVTNIQPVNVPNGLTASIINAEKVIRVRGPKEMLDAMTVEQLRIKVDFTGAEAGTASYRALVVIPPEYAEHVGVVGTYDVNATLTGK